MSKYFQPIEFPVEADPELPRPTETVWDTDAIVLAEASILAEIDLLKAGTSQYSAYALDPGKNGFPAVNALRTFVRGPNDRALKSFEDTANSTFGSRAGKAFTAKLRACMSTREVNNG